MAKMKDKNSAKSLAMVFITGLTLVAVTLCWFAIMDRSSVEKIQSSVENTESTRASIYYGADFNGKIAITRETVKRYINVQDNTITLENMIPGAEYTYMARFSSVKKGQVLTLTLKDILNVQGELLSSVKLNRRVSKMQSDINDISETEKKKAEEVFLKSADGVTFEYKADSDGTFAIFYTLKITEETKTDKCNMSVKITNVDAIISDV